ncbi:integral membrane protein [Dialister micraerophilus DSM 19965]|uniref:Integral membrane protein n=1 Tax=Dialister micraerophilus DSM 19965 TaxID=888062 RepID=F2BWS2_9FIRM|nr:integral membrane protein [Dialister micraerophilus DSM 19965]
MFSDGAFLFSVFYISFLFTVYAVNFPLFIFYDYGSHVNINLNLYL